MSAFAIFFIVLTLAYIIYYSVIIMQDVYGKKDDGQHSEEEVFDVQSMADGEEVPTAITEDNTYATPKEETPEAGVTIYDSSNYQPEADDSGSKQVETAEEQCKRYQNALEDAYSDSTGATEPDNMIEMLVNQKPGGPKIFIKRKNV